MQPGDSISPNQPQVDDPQPEVKDPLPQAPQQTSAPESAWQFTQEDTSSQNAVNEPMENISWTASEFISHEKDARWFAMLGIGTALLMIVTYIVTRDFISTIVMLIVSVMLGSFATRRPRVLQYAVDTSGVHIGDKLYGYDMFKSFSLMQEGGVRSIYLMPLKRFMPPISIYMDPADEEKIVNALSNYLPFEQRQPDTVDKLMRHLRF